MIINTSIFESETKLLYW